MKKRGLRAMLGDVIFGVDNETMESVVIDMLRDRWLESRYRGVTHRWTDGYAIHFCVRRE